VVTPLYAEQLYQHVGGSHRWNELTRTQITIDGSLTEGLILTPQTDSAAREAIEAYIEATDDEALATELQAWLDRCLDDDLRTDGGIDITDVAASRRDMLAAIAKLHEGRSPKGTHIAAHAGIDTAHVYHILNVLEDKQLIVRQTDPRDDRVSRTTLTDAGVAVLQQLQHQYEGLDLSTVQSEPSTDDSDDIRTDGGTPMADCPPHEPVSTQSASLVVDTDTPTVSIDGDPTIQIRPDHADIPVAATEPARVGGIVLDGLTAAMTALTARCSAITGSTADKGGEG
jgi:DNA-binding MarR family transcriptional regulator